MIPLLVRFWKPAAALILGAVIWWSVHHYGATRFEAGQESVKAADAKATEDLRTEVAKLTANNLALAAAAKAHHDDEHAQNLTAAAVPVGTSQLCKPAPDHRSGGVREGSTAHAGDAAAPATTELGSAVPQADHGLADDRPRLLGAFAALFDDQTAVIREFQAR